MAGDRLSALPRLLGAQARASAPDAHVWLSASAGTGKTQVLAARVFRLLLRGVDPRAILCLTFTKAGAAEMAERVNRRLAAWVRMPDTALSGDLQALGERGSPDERTIARTLFARVLDAPGGGLRIQTIHGFCQTLLAAFPLEAGLTPGFRPLEAREEAVLLRETLAALLTQAEREGRGQVVEAVGQLARRLSEDGAAYFLRECARAEAELERLPSGVGPWLRRRLDLPSGDIDAVIAAGCGAVDTQALQAVAAHNAAWGTKSGLARADTVVAWLAMAPAARAAALAGLHLVWAKADGDPRASKGQVPHVDYAGHVAALHGHCAELLALRPRVAYADALAEALEVGRDYARAYADAKRRAGAVDFDDLIGATVALLDQPGMGDWVRYKLDQATEHVLIDEAQDTNAAQWRIIVKLTEEFFAGEGARGDRLRTIFTVGDHKQAIYGFQGTDPRNFAAAQIRFGERARDAIDPDTGRGHDFHALSLTSSFRSTRPVLDFVDKAIEMLPAPGLGLFDAPPLHVSEVRGPGQVTLWHPVTQGGTAEDEEGWIDDATRELARRIACQIRDWLRDGLWLGSKGRALRPEDVMILVKRRGELASLIVARLYAEGVPVAGVDRLRLTAPLAVQDLLAAVRFVLQPGDDLALASLLVSPLLGWSQDELMAAAIGDAAPLWAKLQRRAPDRLDDLHAMLGRADYTTPYQFLEELLSGPLDGRRKLIRRLGAAARDPIDELLGAALDFERTGAPSLQRFLDWFDRGEVEIVRDPSQPLDAVRVMTAHGAKGLQAPLVILADATGDPERKPRSTVLWHVEGEAGLVTLPVFPPRKDERVGPIADAVDAADKRDLEEHWRLFYVAATRAEERLEIAGALGPRAQGVPPASSWYATTDRALAALGAPEVEGGVARRTFTGDPSEPPVAIRPRTATPVPQGEPLPEWARRPAPQEARPPRPLAPSSLGDDDVADAPPSPGLRAAAERGRLIHALFERLPAVAPAGRVAAADRWLTGPGGVADADARAAIVATVQGVIDDPTFAALFGPDALAEAPIAAVVPGGHVVTGTVDRLLVTPELIRVIDFKTGRHPPATLAEIPSYHLRQMAAYTAALGVIFPDRAIEAGLLYTAAPRLFTLPRAMLDAAKPGFMATEQS